MWNSLFFLGARALEVGLRAIHASGQDSRQAQILRYESIRSELKAGRRKLDWAFFGLSALLAWGGNLAQVSVANQEYRVTALAIVGVFWICRTIQWLATIKARSELRQIKDALQLQQESSVFSFWGGVCWSWIDLSIVALFPKWTELAAEPGSALNLILEFWSQS